MPQVSVRAKIVESGMEIFYFHGFHGCSVQDITDHAGVPKGSFYNHFKSKEGLALEVLDRYVEAARLEMLADGSKEPFERLVAHFRYMAKMFKAGGNALGCLAGNLGSELSTTNGVMRKALVKRFCAWQDAVASTIREAQAVGDVHASRDPAQLARFIVAAWEGSILAMKINQSARPLDDFFDQLPTIWGARPAKTKTSRSGSR